MNNSLITLRAITGGRAVTSIADKPTIAEVSNLKMVTRLIGKIASNPKQENMIAVMRAYALEIKGKFDEEDLAIDVEGEDADLTIYGFVQRTEDDEVYIEYQALVETHDPRRFYTGEPADTISAAVKNVKIK